MPDPADAAGTPAPRVVVTSLAADRQALAGQQPAGQQPAVVQPVPGPPAAVSRPATPDPCGQPNPAGRPDASGQQVAGQPAGGSEGAHVPLVPSGMCHGAVLGSAITLCGLDTAALSWFPGLPFSAADFLARCRVCLDLLSTSAC